MNTKIHENVVYILLISNSNLNINTYGYITDFLCYIVICGYMVIYHNVAIRQKSFFIA